MKSGMHFRGCGNLWKFTSKCRLTDSQIYYSFPFLGMPGSNFREQILMRYLELFSWSILTRSAEINQAISTATFECFFLHKPSHTRYMDRYVSPSIMTCCSPSWWSLCCRWRGFWITARSTASSRSLSSASCGQVQRPWNWRAVRMKR